MLLFNNQKARIAKNLPTALRLYCIFRQTKTNTALKVHLALNHIPKILNNLLYLQVQFQFYFSTPQEYIGIILCNNLIKYQIMSKTCTVKYLVVGDSGVGKTSMLLRYCEDTFQHQYLSTIGVDFKIKRVEINGVSITLNIWDTAGQQRFRNITKSFYKGAHGIILLYSIADPQSFEHIQNWIDQIKESGSEDTAMILVGAKSDLKSERKISFEAGSELAAKYDLKLVQTSSKENNNIDEVFQSLTEKVMGSVDLKNEENSSNNKLAKKNKSKKNNDCCS